MMRRKTRTRAPRLVHWALWFCPEAFRDAHRDEILGDVRDRLDAARGLGRLRLQISLTLDLLGAAYRLRRRRETPRPIFSDRSRAGRVAGTVDGLRVDLRAAVRGLLRTPGHSLTIVFTLALALGLAIDVFGVFHGVLLQPLAWDEPDELVFVTAAMTERGVERTGVSGGDFYDVRREVSSFEDVAALTIRRQNLTGLDGPASQVYVGWASGNLFDLLGVEARHGRVFRDGEEPEIVLISSALWRERFGSDPNVLGRKVELDGWAYSIAGVLPAGFHLELPSGGPRADLWRLPDDRWSNGPLWQTDSRDARILLMLGRLREGAGLPEARHQLDGLSAELRSTLPHYDDYGWELRAEALHEALVAAARPMLTLLLGSAACVLAIACANVLHLVLVPAQSRAAELGMRLALGASRARLARHLLLECLLLTSAAGGLGFALSLAGQRLLLALSPDGLPRSADLGLGGSTLLFACATVLGSTLLFGFWPAWRAAHTDLSKWMRGWRSENRGGGAGPWLVATEVALSVMLLAGAGLLAQSVLKLQDVDPGYAVDEAYTFSVSLPSTRYDYRAGDTGRFLERLEAEVNALPGVERAAPVWPAPLKSSRWTGDPKTPSGVTDRADWEIHWVASTARPESALVPALRDRVAAVDPLVPLADPRPLRHLADDQMSLQRFALVLVGIFATVAAVLSAVGLYGVVAYSVNRRRREMGIRMALGSARADIVGLIVRHGGRWIAAGLAVGLGGAVLLSRSLESLLFEVGARDPRTLVAVSAVVASIGLVACLVPALRASRVDPAKVLRAE